MAEKVAIVIDHTTGLLVTQFEVAWLEAQDELVTRQKVYAELFFEVLRLR